MNYGRALCIDHAWEDYELGFVTRREAESVELTMLQDQRLERERLANAKVLVACRHCGELCDVPELAYRGLGRHACRVCWPKGYPRFVDGPEDEVPS